MDKQLLLETLLELRSARISLGTNPSEDAHKQLMDKYDMIFLGEKFNVIHAHELRYYLESKHGIKLTDNDFNRTIPLVCDSIGMKYEALTDLTDAANPDRPITNYSITLS